MSLFLDFHVIQTVGPACINRDEDGSPKTSEYGGVRRVRVSSQAWKRAVRLDFGEQFGAGEVGVRTLRAVTEIANRVAEIAPDFADKAPVAASKLLNEVGISNEKPAKRKKAGEDDADDAEESSEFKTGALVFLSQKQIEALAQIIAEEKTEKISTAMKNAAKDALSANASADLAAFGRMMASAKDLNVDAAVQVAHALGVHALTPEFDFYTAVDDRAPEDSAGAGMMGTVEFNSSTLYRYATVNLSQLVKNLGSGEDAAKVAGAFGRAFIRSMPTGKQNTFANRTLPDFVLVRVRDDQPVSLVGAFEDAIDEPGNRARIAAERLVARARQTDAAYALTPVAEYAAGPLAGDIDSAGETLPFDQLLDRVTEDVRAQVAG